MISDILRPSSWRRLSRRALAVCCIGAAAGLIAGGISVADHYDSMFQTTYANWYCADGRTTNNFCETDNATLTVFFGQTMSSSGESNVRATLDDSFNATDLNVVYHATVVLTGGAETDIVYRVDGAAVPAGFIGWTYCDDAASTLFCDQHYAYFESQPSITLACHESGHSVGLTHGDDASPRVSNTADSLRCMRTPLAYGDRWLGDHNAAQISVTY